MAEGGDGAVRALTELVAESVECALVDCVGWDRALRDMCLELG